MNAKQVNMTLWSGAAALALAAVGSLALGLMWPLERVPGSASASGRLATQPATSNPLPPLASFEKIWNTPLRQVLGDPPLVSPVAPSAVANVTPPGVISVESSNMPVSLVGTIGTSLAIFKTVGNVIEVCAVGETSAGVTVVAVRPAEVDVRFNGQVVKLSKPVEK
jgi:hypothetical protein